MIAKPYKSLKPDIEKVLVDDLSNPCKQLEALMKEDNTHESN